VAEQPDEGVISQDPRDASKPDRNLAMELVRVTEAGALAAGRWIGLGEKESADGAAVDAMRLMLDTVPMDGVVVIGEGEKDEAPMLYNGEEIGDGSPPVCDIAVDPLEGTTLTARGMPSALSVIALSARGTMFDPGPCVYMEKIAAGPRHADLISLDDPLEDVIRRIAEAKGGEISDVTVIMLDRPRHQEAVDSLREVGASIRFISDGDVAAALFAVMPNTGIDLLWGVGGPPRASSAPPRSSASAGASRDGCGPVTTASASPRRTPATTSRACSTPTTWSGATTRSSPRPGSPTATC
jgi:fructose-1,6-bisphosphatase II